MTSTGTKGSWLSQPTVKSLLVYRNGDPFFPGHRIVISEKKVSNFEVFLKEVTAGVKAPFGAVRNIYTPRGGHRVRQLEELRSGEQYVAGGREAFKKLNYLNIGETKKKPPEVNNEVKPVTHSRITVSARFRKPLQEPYTIFLIANGDLISPVVRLLIPRKTLDHWDHILEMVTGKVTIRSGAVHRLYTIDGKLVQNGSDLENGQIYVAAGREKFKKLPYGDLLFRKSVMRRPQGSKASALPPIVGSRKSKGSGSDRQSKSTTGSSDPGENSSSPQFPKRKDKRSHNPENSVSRQHFSNNSTKVKQTVTASTGVLQDNGRLARSMKYVENSSEWSVGSLSHKGILRSCKSNIAGMGEGQDRAGENIFKASGDGSEIWGAAEVQEDEDTHVEVPLDQRPAETVDEEENAEEENDCGEEVYKGEEEYSEVNGEEREKTAKERSEVEENKKLNENYKGEAEETEEDSDSQNQVYSHLEKTSTAPRVTITSPQESEKNRPEQ